MLSILTFFLLDTTLPASLSPENPLGDRFDAADVVILRDETSEAAPGTVIPEAAAAASALTEANAQANPEAAVAPQAIPPTPVPTQAAPAQTPEQPPADPAPAPAPRPSRRLLITEEHDIRPLIGTLDQVPVFNSNNPEVVQQEGILLSTFSPEGKRSGQAHLDFTFEGRFDIFTHHLARARTQAETRTLFQGLLLHNPSSEPVHVEVLQGGSYLTKPDALFVNLPAYVEDPLGLVYAGPGSRLSNELLRGRRQGNWQSIVQIPPRSSYMLMNLPIPVWDRVPSSNARSTLMRLQSDGPLKIANLAMFSPLKENGQERIPTLREWQSLLVHGDLVQPRYQPPTPPGTNPLRYIYGRVGGVAQGSRWESTLTDSPRGSTLGVPETGEAISYVLSTLPEGTFGTGQIQSAPILKRYDDTSYMAHGNYGIEYNLQLPLVNKTDRTQQVAIALQTPLKGNNEGTLQFLDPPEDRVFFRGTVRLNYEDDYQQQHSRYVHLIQQRGQQGQPLVILQMQPGERRDVEVSLIYPPDATPPQVLTVRSLDRQSAQLTRPILSDRRDTAP
ncbi:MAG: DUF3370 domain-containing protein [Cyanobacteria bacterium P01_H01_bin.121]